jgi:vitamin B12/bleomycin/antimicrobial peptide transport system ATP-binding/permease protein
LRKICQDKGIKWRNARGTGKHLTKDEMLAKLREISLFPKSNSGLVPE